MENLNYKNQSMEKKYLKIRKNQFLKELEKYLIRLEDIELKDRKGKIKREIKELIFKLIIVAIDYMDKFEQKEMKKIRPIKKTWYDWVIHYVAKSTRKSVSSFKRKIVSLFKTNTPKQF